MDKLCEVERFNFMLQRDGEQAAIAFARQCLRVYLYANKASRRKYGRNAAYRVSYLESAYSFRWILHHMRHDLKTA